MATVCWDPGRHLRKKILYTGKDIVRGLEGMEVILFTSIKEGGHTPTYTPQLSEKHTSVLMLTVFFSFCLASLLTCWHLSTTVKITIDSVPSQVVEGENVLLRANNLPQNLLTFAWFKGVTNMNFRIALYTLTTNLSVMGPENSGRAVVYSNGSLWLKNVSQNDTGFYILQTVNIGGKIVSTATTYLHVYGK